MDLARNGDAQELLEAQAHVWNHTFNFINSMSLKCAIQLGIPDIIHKHGRPMTLSKLIHALPINNAKAPFVFRLMRILIHLGFIIMAKSTENNDEEEEGYMLTSASRILLKNEPLSVTPFLLGMLDPILIDPWHHLSQWFQNDDETSFKACHGMGIWELAGREPLFNQLFNEAMANDSCLVGNVLTKNCKNVFLELNSLVDVGAGTGTLAKNIADAFPQMKCIVLDLPHVVDGLGKESENLTYIKGDMLEAIPPADAVILTWILHDWSDEECIQILEKCKEAIPNKEKGGKVIIIDMVLHEPEKGVDAEAIETQLCFDMLMMVNTTGKERNEKEWAKLFYEAGFDDCKINPVLGLKYLIEVYYY